MSTNTARDFSEFEDALSQAGTREQGSTGAFVALLASNLILVLMLCA